MPGLCNRNDQFWLPELLRADHGPGGKVDVDVDEDHDAGGDVERSQGGVENVAGLLTQLKQHRIKMGKELGGL